MTAPVTLAFVTLAAGGASLLVASAVLERRAAPDLDELIPALDLDDDAVVGSSPPMLSRVGGWALGWLARRLQRLLPAHYLDKVAVQLVHAGLSATRTPAEHVATQLGLAAAGAAAVVLLPVSTPSARLAVLLLPAMGFMLPAVRLRRAITSRAEAAFKDLPDIVDMLAIAVEAGSGFEAAIELVCRNFDSPLAEEFRVALREMELGMTRREALQAMRERIDLDAVRVLILALLQADALGIPIGRVLKGQANEVRARRRAWAREKAAKLPVKIMFPLVLFIFPPIMALVLGPAAFSFGKLG